MQPPTNETHAREIEKPGKGNSNSKRDANIYHQQLAANSKRRSEYVTFENRMHAVNVCVNLLHIHISMSLTLQHLNANLCRSYS